MAAVFPRTRRWNAVPLAEMGVAFGLRFPRRVAGHQGQFPAITINFNLAPGVSLGQATAAIGNAQTEMKLPATITTGFQGTARAFQASLATVPLLILGALTEPARQPTR